MFHKTLPGALFLMLLSLLTAAAAHAQQPAGANAFYVSPKGNDEWTGTLPQANAEKTDGPFKTIERARDAVRAMKSGGTLPPGGITVSLREGNYYLEKPLEFTKEDAASADTGTTYAAFSGETVRLIGAKAVNNFIPVVDPAVVERLDPAARDHVIQADLKALGVSDFGTPAGGGLGLYFNGQPMTLSRWPNEGFVKIVDIVEQDGHTIHGIPGSKIGKFVYEGDRPSRWTAEKDAWVHGYWFWDWSDQRQKIAAIEPATSVLTVAEPYHGYGYRKGQWYYAFNLLSELDTPGEWYLDRETGILYFWPPEPISGGTEVLVTVIDNLVVAQEAQNITLTKLTFECCRADAIKFSGGVLNHVTGCVIRNTGANAVVIANESDSGVFGCDLYQLGGGGISLSGGDRKTLTPAALVAENNHIYDYGRWSRMYQPAISLNGVGNRAVRNLIHDAPHMAIQFSGNDQLIELNEIHHVCLESNDAGAIYAGRDWTMRGNVIRYNYLHDVTGFEGRGCVGVYLDDMFASAQILGNIFERVTMAAFIGGGRDNSIDNNVFVDCNPALHIDARALGWAHYHADEWIKEAQEKGTVSGIAYKEPPYSERFPELPGIIEDEPKAPKGNVIIHNICVGGRWDDDIEEKARPYLTFVDNHVGEDPGFVDPANHDFRLKPDSPMLKKGFVPIPTGKIGPYSHANRASWPVK